MEEGSVEAGAGRGAEFRGRKRRGTQAGGSQEQAQEDFGGQGSWLSSICYGQANCTNYVLGQ